MIVSDAADGFIVIEAKVAIYIIAVIVCCAICPIFKIAEFTIISCHVGIGNFF